VLLGGREKMMSTILKALWVYRGAAFAAIGVLLLALLSAGSYGANPAGAVDEPVPKNDNWLNATDLGSFALVLEGGSTEKATMEAGEPSPVSLEGADCGWFGISNTVWYKIRPSYDGELKISSEGSSLDTALTLYQGTAVDQLTQVACSNANDAPNWTDTMKVPVEKGQTYYLQLSGTGGVRFGNYKIEASLDCSSEQCLKVATFNVGWSYVEAKEFTADGKGICCRTPEEVKADLERFGRDLLSRADVVLLQEVKNDDWVKIMAESAGLPHWYSSGRWGDYTESAEYADNAIISRYPLSRKFRHRIPPFITFPSLQCPYAHINSCSSEMLEATADIDGVPHLFLGSHWENRPDPWTEHPNRITSALMVQSRLWNEQNPAFFGGDLNVCVESKATIPDGPDEGEERDPNPEDLCVNGGSVDAPGTEINLLTKGDLSVLDHSLEKLGGRKPDMRGLDPGRVKFCEPIGYIIDHIFSLHHGSYEPYKPVMYQHCWPTSQPGVDQSNPSDHVFELVVFVKKDTTAPSAPVINGPSEDSRNNTGNFAVSGIAEAGSTVEVFEGSDSRGKDTADASGNWSVSLSAVTPDGQHTYTARATDADGNTSDLSASRTVIVDTTAPAIVAVTPPNGARTVARGTNVTATFSEEMERGTLTTDTFKLVKKRGSTTPVPAGVSYDPDTRTATLDPASGLRRGTTYVARITTGTRDASGNALAAEKVWRFTVR
jgi:hypothetical protein